MTARSTTSPPRLDSLLTHTLRTGDLSEAAVNVAEVGLDHFLADGLVRDVPIIGSFVAALRAGCAVRDYVFLRKLLAFLGPLRDVDQKRRDRMIRRLEADPAYGERVGEHLLVLLERLDSLTKPTMLGRAFRAYLEEKIDTLTLQRLSLAIDRVMLYDLRFLKSFLENPDGAQLSPSTRQSFVLSGLAHVPPGLLTPHVWPIKDVCQPFVEYVLRNDD